MFRQTLEPPLMLRGHTSDHDVDADVAPGAASLRVRTLWISDVHLGTADCKADALLHLLKTVRADRVYLVGDIVDGWQLRKRWYWPQAHNDVIQKLLRKARKGAHITFVAGNHDEFARQFVGLSFGGIDVVDEAVHTLADGRRLWVTHGDHLDGVIQHAKWLARLGDELYLFTLKLNNWLNRLRRHLDLPYWSLSLFLKQKVKNAVAYIDSFERALALEAAERGCDGVVCGHIHKAEIRSLGAVTYHNCGDWVESCTALVEDYAGQVRILHLNDLPRLRAPRDAAAALGTAA
ncbi:MAG: UDP-2,3-diacylglucosamine diphosphatase [Betaproteobacteria bacterium]|nr:UDP-2,3-diacylglucosamine diphosphatase [Betaproteobacteria bacterium]MDE2048459.1 UDP-2,3-diacylglucosamine diphosphatase [Betaproteobacteria bacterium]